MEISIELLNEERKRQKLSIAELAERANLPKSTVEKILFRIVKYPRIDTLWALAGALGIEIKNPPDNLSGGAAEWMELYNTLTDENKDLLVSMVKVFAELPPERRRFVLDAIRFAGDNQK